MRRIRRETLQYILSALTRHEKAPSMRLHLVRLINLVRANLVRVTSLTRLTNGIRLTNVIRRSHLTWRDHYAHCNTLISPDHVIFRRYRLHVLIMLLVAAPIVTVDAGAQDVPAALEDTVRVTLTDGDVVVGTVVSETEASLVLLTVSGVQMTIPREQVRSIESASDRRFDRMDPNRSRLLFAPTGRPLEKGSGYVSVYELFFPFVAYGPGGKVTLAGGISLIPGAGGQLVYAAPKITLYERQETTVAAGILASTILGENFDDDVPTFGLLYAVGTWGSSRAWLTGGLAFGFADGEISRSPAVLLGGEIQLSNTVKLMTENYVFINVDEGLLMSGGFRFFGDRIAADLALMTIPALIRDVEGFPFFPWLGFAYNFSQ